MADLLMEAHPGGALLMLVITAAWCLGEYLKHRRIREFGDCRVLGVRQRWAPKVTGIALFALGVAAAASILWAREPNDSSRSLPEWETRVYLDLESPAAPGFSGLDPWMSLDSLLAALASGDLPCRMSLHRLAEPSVPVIPATEDLEGYRILLERSRIEWSVQRGGGGRAEMLAPDKPADGNAVHMLLFLTARAPEEIAQHLTSGLPRASILVILRPQESSSSTPRYWYRSREQGWAQAEGLGELAAMVAAPPALESNGGLFERQPTIRSFALAAFVLLLLEYVLAGFWPRFVREE